MKLEGRRVWPREWLLVIVLIGAVCIAYSGVGECGFVSLDDPGYVQDQPMVNQGIRSAALVWAFTATHGGNWHPFTSLSHMLDCELFGVSPGPMHWINVAWHIANTILLFVLGRSVTGCMWGPALVAGLFALHPIHVESVAWISERKDVLSTFFWLLGLIMYVSYARTNSAARYAATLLCMLCGLMSKPMLVTFPLTLLVLDFWPLRRWAAFGIKGLLQEKLPFVALAVVSSIITYLVQHSAGAGALLPHLSISARLGNALVSYARYLHKIWWPDRLGIFYPHPGFWSVSAVTSAAVLLTLITALTIWQMRRRPWLFFGWAWFLLTLVPVIGMVQVGVQAMADRYSYVPSLGIFTIVACAAAELARRQKWTRMALGVAAGAVLGCCIVLTRQQTATWRDGVSLFEQSLVANRDNVPARLGLADALAMAGRPEGEYVTHLRRALELEPTSAVALSELAGIAARNERPAEARALLEEALQAHPSSSALLHARGVLSSLEDQSNEAIRSFTEALRIAPDRVNARRELAWIYFRNGDLEEAADQLHAAVAVDPWDYRAWHALGVVRNKQGRLNESRNALERALWIHPGFSWARESLRLLPQ